MRYITLWPDGIEWDFYVSENEDEVKEVVSNLRKQGKKKFTTYLLGAQFDEFSKDWNEE